MMPSGLFTVGYGNRPIEAFLDLLGDHGITHVADVRSIPYSRAHPDFGRATLRAHLKASGRRYTYLGETLGGRDLAPPRQFHDALRRLVRLSRHDTVVALCAELRPEQCHRVHLLGAALDGAGIPVHHLDENGRALTHAEAVHRLTRGQVTLEGAVAL
jgi:uncharacterized protein (DUF488 family)